MKHGNQIIETYPTRHETVRLTDEEARISFGHLNRGTVGVFPDSGKKVSDEKKIEVAGPMPTRYSNKSMSNKNTKQEISKVGVTVIKSPAPEKKVETKNDDVVVKSGQGTPLRIMEKKVEPIVTKNHDVVVKSGQGTPLRIMEKKVEPIVTKMSESISQGGKKSVAWDQTTKGGSVETVTAINKQSQIQQSQIKQSQIKQTEIKSSTKPIGNLTIEIDGVKREITESDKQSQIKQSQIKQSQIQQSQIQQSQIQQSQIKQSQIKQSQIIQTEIKSSTKPIGNLTIEIDGVKREITESEFQQRFGKNISEIKGSRAVQPD